MSKKAKITVDEQNKRVVIEREFNSPRELLFQAFIEPDLIVKWWGPKDVRTIIEQMDVRPNGAWKFISENPDGSRDIFYGNYLEISEPELISETFNYEPIGPGHESLDTAEFREIDGKTNLVTTSEFKSIDDLKGMMESGMEEGLNESYERLDELMEKLKAE